MEQFQKRRREDMPLDKPNQDGNVWPKQSCPAFTPRGGSSLKQCWYCIFADFHLETPKSLEVGICCYPKKNENISK